MHGDFSQIGPFLLAALLVFVIYRRFRRNFGRQKLRPKRMTFRIVLLVVIGTLLLPSALKSTQFLGAELGGLALGVGLALWGAQRTRFLRAEGELYYIPHTYTGVVVSMLFLGRLVFRILQVTAGAHAAQGASPGDGFQRQHLTPLTVGIFFVLIAYYVYFYSWVLWRSKHLEAADIETDAAPLPGK